MDDQLLELIMTSTSSTMYDGQVRLLFVFSVVPLPPPFTVQPLLTYRFPKAQPLKLRILNTVSYSFTFFILLWLCGKTILKERAEIKWFIFLYLTAHLRGKGGREVFCVKLAAGIAQWRGMFFLIFLIIVSSVILYCDVLYYNSNGVLSVERLSDIQVQSLTCCCDQVSVIACKNRLGAKMKMM